MLRITPAQLEQISQHLVASYPEEGCGLLIGKQGTVAEVWPMVNSWSPEIFEGIRGESNSQAASKKNRFSIAPEAMLAAQKRARDLKLNIIGIYHSHPDHIARPSEFDRAIAHPGYSYLIAAVREGKLEEITSWVLDSEHQFQPESILTNLDRSTLIILEKD